MKQEKTIEKKDVMWLLKVLDFGMPRGELIQKIDELSTINLLECGINAMSIK